jgi:hypothetical protein
MKFYWQPDNDVDVPREARRYQTRFPHTTTGRIACELLVRVVKWQPARIYETSCFFTSPDGGVQKRSYNWPVYNGRAFSELGYWWEKDRWMPGKYDVWFLMDGVEVARSGYVIESPPPPKPPPAPTEVLQLPSVQFYTSGRENIRFPQQTTREVSCVLTVHNLLYQQEYRHYSVTVQWCTVEGRVLSEEKRTWTITSQEQETSITWNIQTSGWRQGIYRVEILIDGDNFAWGAFTIE